MVKMFSMRVQFIIGHVRLGAFSIAEARLLDVGQGVLDLPCVV